MRHVAGEGQQDGPDRRSSGTCRSRTCLSFRSSPRSRRAGTHEPDDVPGAESGGHDPQPLAGLRRFPGGPPTNQRSLSNAEGGGLEPHAREDAHSLRMRSGAIASSPSRKSHGGRRSRTPHRRVPTGFKPAPVPHRFTLHVTNCGSRTRTDGLRGMNPAICHLIYPAMNHIKAAGIEPAISRFRRERDTPSLHLVDKGPLGVEPSSCRLTGGRNPGHAKNPLLPITTKAGGGNRTRACQGGSLMPSRLATPALWDRRESNPHPRA